MKTMKFIPMLMVGLLVVLLTSCGPSYVGVGSGYPYGRPYYGYNYGYGYPYSYGPPAYGYRYRRPPVIVQRRTYVNPPRVYNNGRGNYAPAPNARMGNGNGNYGGRSRGPR